MTLLAVVQGPEAIGAIHFLANEVQSFRDQLPFYTYYSGRFFLVFGGFSSKSVILLTKVEEKITFQHTEITLSAMKQMGIIKDELTTSAGFVIEFRSVLKPVQYFLMDYIPRVDYWNSLYITFSRQKPSPSVRLLNHDPHPLDKHVIYKVL